MIAVKKKRERKQWENIEKWNIKWNETSKRKCTVVQEKAVWPKSSNRISLLHHNTADYVAALRGCCLAVCLMAVILFSCTLQHKHIALRSLLIWHSVLQRADVPQIDQMSFVVCLNIEHHNLCDFAEHRVKCKTLCCSKITCKVMNSLEGYRELVNVGEDLQKQSTGHLHSEMSEFDPFCYACSLSKINLLSFTCLMYLAFQLHILFQLL